MKRVSKQSKLEEINEEVSNEMPSLITLNEFIASIAKQNFCGIESLNSFAYWIKKKDCPKKWPHNIWKNELIEFLARKVK